MKTIPDPDRLSSVLTLIVLILVALLFVWLLGGFVAWIITRQAVVVV